LIECFFEFHLISFRGGEEMRRQITPGNTPITFLTIKLPTTYLH